MVRAAGMPRLGICSVEEIIFTMVLALFFVFSGNPITGPMLMCKARHLYTHSDVSR